MTTGPHASTARRLDRIRERIAAVIGAAVTQRRAAEARGAGYGDDLLGLLLLARDENDAAGGGLSDAEVVDEAMTILLAGHETTASALAWTWLLLDRHPEAQAAVEAETDALGASGSGPLIGVVRPVRT